ncbi:TRAP transporter substrate-binding protein [Ammoniphilus sp. 3BR4]|uniref:TRAP transporter substrate-binding protein n=1 Tax=Ammoniphilus sp. 3BR4 TaxID=3158265 RepID=UPI0034659B90
MKKFKKVLSYVVLSSALAAVATGCGSSSPSTNEPTASSNQEAAKENTGEKITIKFGHHLSENHSLHEQVVKFGEIVSQKTNGQVQVEIYSNGQLGDQRDLLEGLKLGTVDMALGDSGVVANYYPQLGVLDLPYLFKDVDHSIRALDGELGGKLKEGILQTAGFRTLAIEPTAYRSVVLAKDTVKSIEDFKGLSVRTLQAPQIIETFNSFGAQPVAMPSGEAFTGMQTGAVDGMESNPEFLKSIKVWEAGKYYVDTTHSLTHETINISEQFYSKLPDDVKKAVEESVNETVVWFHDYTKQVDIDSRKALQDNGMTFVEFDLEPFKQAAVPVSEKLVKDNGWDEFYQLVKDAEGK